MSALGELGEFIRQQRRTAQISVRQLAERAGVSNPYLSQIERGLRKPSAEVLRQIAAALAISPPVMFLRAGLLHATEGSQVTAAIAADPGLTSQQKQLLTKIYQQFIDEGTESAQPDSAADVADSATADSADRQATTKEQ